MGLASMATKIVKYIPYTQVLQNEKKIYLMLWDGKDSIDVDDNIQHGKNIQLDSAMDPSECIQRYLKGV
jgi:hypothetical protein